MKLIPYSNMFETDIPDKDFYLQWKKDELEEFKDKLLSKGMIRQYYVDEYGRFNVKGRDQDSYWSDILTLFSQSTYNGYPRWSIPLHMFTDNLNEDNYIKPDINKDFTYNWNELYFSNTSISTTQDILEKSSWNIEDLVITNNCKTKSFTGVFSEKDYVNYIYDVGMSSTDEDTGELAVVVMKVSKRYFETTHDYTISAVRSIEDKSWYLVYNYKQLDEKILVDASDTIDPFIPETIETITPVLDPITGDPTYDLNTFEPIVITTVTVVPPIEDSWSNNPNGMRIKCYVTGSKMTLYTTQRDSQELDVDTKLEFDCDWEQKTLVFNDKRKHVGVAVHQQKDARFEMLDFIEFGDSYPAFLGRTLTMLLRGDNYSGRHLIPKFMNQLDYNKMLLIDDSHELGDNNIIATIFPMFRTIVLGYHVTGMTNGGTDLIPSVETLADIKNILDIIYGSFELRQFNVIIEGDIPQTYVNHLYLEGERLNIKYGTDRDWLDMYVLPDLFIDRINTRVTQQYFDVWGYHKFPYQLPHFPYATERMIHATSKNRDSHHYKDDLDDRKRSIYPNTVSLRRVTGLDMLLGLLSGENVEKFEHYKVTGPIECKEARLPEYMKSIENVVPDIEIPDDDTWDTEETKESEIVEAIGGSTAEETVWNGYHIALDADIYSKYSWQPYQFTISSHMIAMDNTPKIEIIDSINDISHDRYQDIGLPEIQALIVYHTIDSSNAVHIPDTYEVGRLGISNIGWAYKDWQDIINVAGIESDFDYCSLYYEIPAEPLPPEPIILPVSYDVGDLHDEVNIGIPNYLYDLNDDQSHFNDLYNYEIRKEYDGNVRVLIKDTNPEINFHTFTKFVSNPEYNILKDKLRNSGAESGLNVSTTNEYKREFSINDNEIQILLTADGYNFIDYIGNYNSLNMGNGIGIPSPFGKCGVIQRKNTEEISYCTVECEVYVPEVNYKHIEVYSPPTRFPSMFNIKDTIPVWAGVLFDTEEIANGNTEPDALENKEIVYKITYLPEINIED